MNFRAHFRSVPDFPASGQIFYDLSPLLADAAAFSTALEAMAGPARLLEPSHILGLESRGFVFASALAQVLGVGFVAARRPGKLPPPCFREAFGPEEDDALELQQEAFKPWDRVLIVDDVLATGATAAAARALIQRSGAQPVGLATFVELEALPGREKLAGMPVTSLVRI